MLASAPDLASTQVTVGVPTVLEGQDTVSVLGVTDSTEEEAGLGGNRKREEFTVEVKIMSFDPAATSADDAFDLEARAGDLAQVVRDVVHGDRTLGGALTGNVASVVGTPTDGAQPAQDGGYVVFASVLVRCRSTVSDG